MLAVVKTGGKQYSVKKGDFIDVEKIDGKVGDKINLEVLLLSSEKETLVGTPVLENVSVSAKIVMQGKQDKIVVFKYKPKKNERKKQGHRQPFTKLEIVDIKVK